MKAAINKLYGTSAGSSGLSRRNVQGAAVEQRELPGTVSHIESSTVSDEEVNGKYRQYLANILSQKFALNGSYAIFLFLGDYDDDPSAWATSPNLVGTHAVFAALSSAEASSNSQTKQRRDQPSIQVTGTMPLTSMLLAKAQSGDLDSMDLDAVADYLTDNLHWRVAMVRIIFPCASRSELR